MTVERHFTVIVELAALGSRDHESWVTGDGSIKIMKGLILKGKRGSFVYRKMWSWGSLV